MLQRDVTLTVDIRVYLASAYLFVRVFHDDRRRRQSRGQTSGYLLSAAAAVAQAEAEPTSAAVDSGYAQILTVRHNETVHHIHRGSKYRNVLQTRALEDDVVLDSSSSLPSGSPTFPIPLNSERLMDAMLSPRKVN